MRKEAELKCVKCGGLLFRRYDFKYNIHYYSCYKCGHVEFEEDGLGIVRLRLPKEGKTYERICPKCGKAFLSASPNYKGNCDGCQLPTAYRGGGL